MTEKALSIDDQFSTWHDENTMPEGKLATANSYDLAAAAWHEAWKRGEQAGKANAARPAPRPNGNDKGKEPVAASVTVEAATPKALMVRVEGVEPFWVPRSQVMEGTDVFDKGDVGTLVMPRWLAEKRGLGDAPEGAE